MAFGGNEAVIPAHAICGLLLCRAAELRLAFLAEHVTSIELFCEGLVPHAAELFGAAELKGKVLRHASGAGVGVDGVEVHGDTVELYPPPRLLLAGLGGSLYGFVALHQTLYPVLRLSEFARFLSSQRLQRA